MDKYDVVVLGSGPGGQRAAVQAAKLKKKVLIIERDAVGGACLHRGTIPSKTLREAAIKHEGTSHVIRSVMEQTRNVVQAEADIISHQLERNGVEFARGAGRLESPHEVGIVVDNKKRVVRADYIVIAVGARPLRPSDIPFDERIVFDGETILGIRDLPKTLVILGAGVIGCEYASFFGELGVKVTMVDRRDAILKAVDQEIVQALQKHFVSRNIRVYLGANPSNVRVENDRVLLNLGTEKVNFDAMLYCMGRIGNIDGLNLSAAGIDLKGSTLIPVNADYQTNVPHIYAVGDIIGPPALAASSAEQGRLAMVHAYGISGGKFPESFPYGIYTIPEISSVGVSEEELKEKQVPYVVGRGFYKEIARGKILNEEDGFLKLMVHRQTRKLLGIHIIGSGATELVHIGQVAMALGADIDFLVNNVFNYPTLAEAYKVAAYAAFNQLRESP